MDVNVECDEEALRRIWEQGRIPVVVRSDLPGVRLKLRLPYAADNRQWIEEGHQARAQWILGERLWYLPKAWFNSLVDRALLRYGQIYILQPYQESEICAPACWNAVGHICQCSCMGANHGTGDGTGFFEVSECFAFRDGPKFLAARLLAAKNKKPPLVPDQRRLSPA